MCVVVIIKQVEMYTPACSFYSSLFYSSQFLSLSFGFMCVCDLSLPRSLSRCLNTREIQTLGLKKCFGKGGKSHKSALISTSDSTYIENTRRRNSSRPNPLTKEKKTQANSKVRKVLLIRKRVGKKNNLSSQKKKEKKKWLRATTRSTDR